MLMVLEILISLIVVFGLVLAVINIKNNRKGRLIVFLLILIIPFLGVIIHQRLGNNNVPSVAYKDRENEFRDIKQFEDLITKLAERLYNDPSGGDRVGWELLGDVHMNNGAYGEAVLAYTQLVEKDNRFSQSWIKLAGSLIANEGAISQSALNAIEKSLVLDSSSPISIYYKALYFEQEGRLEEAYTLLINRLDLEKTNADWVDLYLVEANRFGALLGYDKIVRLDSEVPIGPTNADIIEASKLNAIETSAFINSMVSGLVEKLKNEPNDIDGWLRLSRSYIVLKNLTLARESLQEAKLLIEKLPKNDPKIEIYSQLLVDLEDIQ